MSKRERYFVGIDVGSSYQRTIFRVNMELVDFLTYEDVTWRGKRGSTLFELTSSNRRYGVH